MQQTQQQTSQRRETYDRMGYWIERQLFSRRETQQLLDAFTQMHAAGGVEGFYEYNPDGIDNRHLSRAKKGDPLATYPRVMHPHRFMPIALQYFLDPRVLDLVELFLGEAALAAQTMFYFKPPGARGQAWHQDNFYVDVKPGTCLAAWVALDEIDEENGGLKIVLHTQNLPIVCPEKADPAVSFTKERVPLDLVYASGVYSYNRDLPPVPTELEIAAPKLSPGDVLFFNGSVIHGSEPNRTKDRFRRSFISHYVGESCSQVAEYFHPLLTRDGHEVTRTTTPFGGPCGSEFEPQVH